MTAPDSAPRSLSLSLPGGPQPSNEQELSEQKQAALEHVSPDEAHPRMPFEVEHGLSYCRRCGRLIAKDIDPAWRTKKPCQVVRIGFRELATPLDVVMIPRTWNDADRTAGVDYWIGTAKWWYEQTQACWLTRDDVVRAKAERDAAQAEVARLKSLLVSERLGSGVTREDEKESANENELRARIRALHHELPEGFASHFCAECSMAWPCPTIRALEAP